MKIDTALSHIRRTFSRRRVSRTVVVALTASILQMWSSFIQPAAASGTPVVTMPANGWIVGQSATTTISGSSVSGLSAGSTYLVTVSLTGSINGATLKMPTTTNLTASYGYTTGSNTFTSFTKISFTGLEADVNNGLAALQYVASTAAGSGTTPTISISVVENVTGTAFNPTNGHYYRAISYVSSLIPGTALDNKQSTAFSYANTLSFAGQAGYLVTITSSDENTFVGNTINNASNIWIGARDNASNTTGSYSYSFAEGSWGWGSPGSPEYGTLFWKSGTGAMYETSTAGGAPSLGYSNWCSGEPNNAGGENSGVTNWSGGTCWNDLPDQYSSVNGFVVEFGDKSATGGFTGAVTSSAKVYVAPALSRFAGNNQIAPPSTALPLPVKAVLKDSVGTIIPGATVNFAASTGTVSAASATTDSSGVATLATWTMPASVGGDVLTASYNGAGNPSITFAAKATGYSAANLDTDSALSFNGTSQYVLASTATIVPTAWNAPFTVEAWVYPTTSNAHSMIYGQGTGTSRFYIKKYNNQLVWFRDGWGFGSEQVCGSLISDEWTHVALSFNGTNAYCYINSELTLISAPRNSGTVSLNTPSVIGQYSNNLTDATAYWVGGIDEVKVWDNERSQSNIAIDMTSRTSPTASGLLAYYDFNEGAGSILYNQDRDSVTATAPIDMALTGSPTWNSSYISSTSTTAPYTTTTFKRTYITAAGGWKVPGGPKTASALLLGGGGGGGYNSGGGGSGGGVTYIPTTQISSVLTVTVGVGGLGSNSLGSAALAGKSTVFGATTVAGGNPGVNYSSGAAAGGTGVITSTGTSGAGGAGTASSASAGSAGSAGIQNSITGTSTYYAGGGGGGGWATNTNGGAGGSGGGGAGGNTSSRAGYAGTANTGGGGGGGSETGVIGGSGGSGVIIIRWITALVPAYTKPSNAYLNVGMTETFTTNVAVDSATVGLTRTFRWESTTGGVNGTFTVIKQGTGAANAAFSWIPTDTSTSGANYLYRLIVTDSDTAGLYITDSSTAYATINLALALSGKLSVSKTVNISKTETYTVLNGTPTYTYSLTPTSPNFWLDTSIAGSPRLKLADTVTVGTYYETLTVTDSVSASIIYPLTITVNPPPSLSANAAQVDSGTVLYLDAGNRASYSGSGTAWTDLSGRNLSTSLAPTGMVATNSGPTSCAQAGYSSEAMGSITFNKTTKTCGYTTALGVLNTYTAQVWVKRDGLMNSYSCVICTPWNTGKQLNISLHWMSNGSIAAGIFRNGTWPDPAGFATAPVIADKTWILATVTFDGTTLNLTINDGVSSKYSGTPDTTAFSESLIIPNLLIGKRFDLNSDYMNGSIGSIRIYNRVLSDSEILQNYNATYKRFLATQNKQVQATKYGAKVVDTYTVTAGSETITSITTNAGITRVVWDTSTARSVLLTVQESITPGTYYDTLTVTDIYGASTNVPISFVISKADTITVTMETSTVTTYNKLPITVYPKPTITGLVNFDTATVTTKFSSGSYSLSTTVPTNADTYTVTGADLTFISGLSSYYTAIVYDTSTAVVNKAKQTPLNISMYGAVIGSPFTITLLGGDGTGAVTETLTGVSTAPNCAISNHVLTSSATQISYCQLKVTKAADTNYLLESSTVQIYFMQFAINMPTNQVGAGTTIALNGETSIIRDPNAAPTISSLSTYSAVAGQTQLIIYGSGFDHLNPAGITVKFWRNQVASSFTVNSGDTQITVTVPAGATTGKVTVTTPNGIAVSEFNLVVTAS